MNKIKKMWLAFKYDLVKCLHCGQYIERESALFLGAINFKCGYCELCYSRKSYEKQVAETKEDITRRNICEELNK